MTPAPRLTWTRYLIHFSDGTDTGWYALDDLPRRTFAIVKPWNFAGYSISVRPFGGKIHIFDRHFRTLSEAKRAVEEWRAANPLPMQH